MTTTTEDRILPNGSRVIAEGEVLEGGQGLLPARIVLADTGSGYQRFVTWMEVLPPGAESYCISGHYFVSHTEAHADFEQRKENER